MGLFKKAKRFVGKVVDPILKPIQKASSKIIPKQLRPFLPYATMFLPGSGILGAMGGPMGFAKMYGANMFTQALSDPEAEFEDLNQLSGIMSGIQGGLSGPGTASDIRGNTTEGIMRSDAANMGYGPLTADQTQTLADRSFLTKASDLGKNLSAGTSDYLQGNIETLQDVGSGKTDLFNLKNAKNAAMALAPDFTKATGDVAVNIARPARREFEEADRLEQAQIEETTTADEGERATLQMRFMRQAGIPEETVEETLVMNDLGDYYEPPVEAAASGGIMGADPTYHQVRDLTGPVDLQGIMGYNMGGSVLPQGMEMDYRGGGFIPMGSKERADDVPARVSKNEFVMTADAVKAAGGGSVNQGAKRMYNLMNNLEAQA
jgi:hypothetical protein